VTSHDYVYAELAYTIIIEKPGIKEAETPKFKEEPAPEAKILKAAVVDDDDEVVVEVCTNISLMFDYSEHISLYSRLQL